MTSNQPDLDHLDALHAAATPGPWHLTDSSAIVAPLSSDEIADVWEPTAASRNGEFIEAAREALPELVAEVRRLRARVTELERREVEAKRNEIRLSYRQLAVQAREERDYEGEATVLQQLADHEADWKRQDATARSAAV